MSGANDALALEIVLAGGLVVRGRGAVLSGEALGGRRAEIAFARLALDAGSAVSRDALAEAIWGEALPSSWRPALRNVIAAIRRALSSYDLERLAALESSDGGYRLALAESTAVDVVRLEADVARVEESVRAGEAERALPLATRALSATRTPVLPQAEGEWVERLRRHVADVRLRLERGLGEAALAAGDAAQAERSARSVIASEPLREDAHRLLMRALFEGGNRGAALSAYDSCRRLLADQLGARPSAETEALFRELLTEDGEGRPVSPERAPAPPSSAPLLLIQQRTPFVGRASLLERLVARLRQARDGGPLLVTLSGEPGLGKTRLAAALAARAIEAGIGVLYGREDDRIAVPYASFVEALDGAVAARRADELAALLDRHAGILGRVLPSLGGAAAPRRPTGPIDLNRLHAEQAIVDALELVSGRDGALLVLDDMQWATRATVDVLEALVRAPTRMRLLVVALHRGQDDPVTLEGLGNHSRIERLTLDPLTAVDVAQLASISGVISPDTEPEALGRRVWRQSGGNPLLASELLRVWRPDGPELPARIAELVRTRLASLPASVEQVLRVAAVAGLEFDPRTVAQASGDPVADALEGLELAVSSGLLLTATRHSEWLAFRHALVRASILESLGSRTRQRLHLQLGSALEERAGEDRDALIGLAYHFDAAAPLGDWRRAVRYALPVARTAYEAGIYEDVISVTTRALAALRDADEPDPRARIDLEILLGGAQRALGEARGFETLNAAFAAARDRADPERMADAALAFSHAGALSDEGFVDDGLLHRYEEAVTALEDRDPARQARLLGHIATAQAWRQSSQASRRAGEAAETLARELGDPELLASVLTSTRRSFAGAARVTEQEQLENDLFRLAERLDDPGLRARTAQWRFDTSVERGRGGDLERLLEVAGDNARGLRMGNCHHSIAYARAALALLRGRVGEADALVERARMIGLERGVDATVVDAVHLFQLIGVRHEQGRLTELREAAYLFIEAVGVPEWFGGLAFIDAEVGQLDAVATNVDQLLHAFIDHGPTFVSPVGYLAHMAVPIARLDDAQRAASVYEQVLPFAGVGAYFAHFAGPIDYHLSLLAQTLGRDADAHAHMAAAVAFCERLGAPRWRERCRAAQDAAPARCARVAAR